MTWRVLGWWTVAYGVSSWLVEYWFSKLDPAGSEPLLYALNRVVYAVVWSGAIVVAILVTDRYPITSRHQVGRILLHVAVCLIVTVLWGVLAYHICLALPRRATTPPWTPS